MNDNQTKPSLDFITLKAPEGFKITHTEEERVTIFQYDASDKTEYLTLSNNLTIARKKGRRKLRLVLEEGGSKGLKLNTKNMRKAFDKFYKVMDVKGAYAAYKSEPQQQVEIQCAPPAVPAEFYRRKEIL